MRNIKNKNIFFLASTLPFAYLRYRENLDACDYIYFTNSGLKESFIKSVDIKSFDDKCRLLATNRIILFLQLTYIFIYAKKIHVFHECAWLLLDLVSLFFIKKVRYTEIIEVAGRQEIKNIKYSQIHLKILSLFFYIYESDKNNGEGVYYVYAMKRQFRPIFFDAKNFLIEKNKKTLPSKVKEAKSILFITCSEGISDDVTRKIYTQAIDIALGEGLLVTIKDHPNKMNRIWPKNYLPKKYKNRIQIMDPIIALNCLDLSGYRRLISIASSGLAQSDDSSIISLINLFDINDTEKLKIRMLHLEALDCYPYAPRCLEELRHAMKQLSK